MPTVLLAHPKCSSFFISEGIASSEAAVVAMASRTSSSLGYTAGSSRRLEIPPRKQKVPRTPKMKIASARQRQPRTDANETRVFAPYWARVKAVAPKTAIGAKYLITSPAIRKQDLLKLAQASLQDIGFRPQMR